jgi:hypothetical protein
VVCPRTSAARLRGRGKLGRQVPERLLKHTLCVSNVALQSTTTRRCVSLLSEHLIVVEGESCRLPLPYGVRDCNHAGRGGGVVEYPGRYWCFFSALIAGNGDVLLTHYNELLAEKIIVLEQEHTVLEEARAAWHRLQRHETSRHHAGMMGK